ncbi:MAG TPA: hypothetical protein VGB70_06570 [Allosphingosinicella sp.]|jgi:hypothetical protein
MGDVAQRLFSACDFADCFGRKGAQPVKAWGKSSLRKNSNFEAWRATSATFAALGGTVADE